MCILFPIRPTRSNSSRSNRERVKRNWKIFWKGSSILTSLVGDKAICSPTWSQGWSSVLGEFVPQMVVLAWQRRLLLLCFQTTSAQFVGAFWGRRRTYQECPTLSLRSPVQRCLWPHICKCPDHGAWPDGSWGVLRSWSQQEVHCETTWPQGSALPGPHTAGSPFDQSELSGGWRLAGSSALLRREDHIPLS